ncbi:MAG TPA: YkgJ family cysteine cluster protein [Terracidiphilus sp.]|nr:YkgJ family cysteine cluster protein [Terracidiphilus sp.]
MPDAREESGPATVNAAFTLSFGESSVQAEVEVPAGQTTLTELLPIIQKLDSAIVDGIAEHARSVGKPVSCRAGCGACCRQMVPVSLFEAEALIAWMQTLPEERRAELEQRFHRALTMLRDAGVIDKILNSDWALGAEQATRMAIEYFHAGVPCPFLEDECCSIHPFRPLSCREYIVTSPPELCKDPSVHNVSGVQIPVKLSRALYAFGQQMEHGPRGWVPLVFLLAWGKSGAKPGDFVSGTGKEVLGRFLDRVATASGTAND